MKEQAAIHISRCRNNPTIEHLLVHDYYDSPLCFFPTTHSRGGRMVCELERHLLPCGGKCGPHTAFVFAHTLEPKIWREFAKRNHHLLPHLAYNLLPMRTSQVFHRTPHRVAHAAPLAAPDRVRQLALPRVDTPFQWSPPDSRTAYITMLHVPSQLRGMGAAGRILREAAAILTGDGIHRLEAHIDAANYASMRAFMAAGWSVVETATHNLKAELQAKTGS